MAERVGEAPAVLQEEKAAFRWRPYQVYVVGLLLLVTVFNYMDRGILGTVQEPLKHELKLSDWQLGLLGGPFFAIFYSLAGVPVARLAERINRGGLLAVCLAFWSGMTALCGAAQNFIQVALCRIGVGAGEGGCIPISHSLLADTFTLRQRGFVLSLLSLAPAISGLVTPSLGGYVAHHYGWRMAFMAVGVPGLLVAGLALLTLRDPRAAEKQAAKGKPRSTFMTDMKWLAGNRAFVFLFIGGAFIGMGVNGVGLFEASFLIRTHGLSVAEAGYLRSFTSLASIVGTFVGGYLADRFADPNGRSYILVSAAGAGLTFLANLATFGHTFWPVVVVFLFVNNFTYALKNGPMYATVQNVVPSHMRATGTAIFMIAATVVGAMVGAPLSGAISDFIAGQRFDAALGVFKEMCPGGRPAPGTSEALAAACRSASADGLRFALCCVSFVFLLASIFLYIASRTIRVGEELVAEERAAAEGKA